MREMTEEQALARAAALCSGSERCVSQIRSKLDSWGIPDDQCGRILTRLREERFIDEARYCRAFCADKLRYNQWGKIKIRQALHMQGLQAEDIEQGLDSLDDKEYRQVLDTLLRRKAASLHEADPYTLRQKLMRHAYAHGFEPELIIRRTSDLDD